MGDIYEAELERIGVSHAELSRKKYIFDVIEKQFREIITNRKKSNRRARPFDIICCTESMKHAIIWLGIRIKRNSHYTILSDSDLYLTLIYIWYSLLGEHGVENSFNMQFLLDNATNKELVEELYFTLTTGDMIEESTGRNLSSDVRRGMLGFSPLPRGGKKPRKKTNIKSHNKKKNRQTKKHVPRK